jgi:SAM-dependent methyltransferase
MAAFKDYFFATAPAYAAYRPRYPDALFDFLAGLAPGLGLVWDCATGNGQAATGLAKRFARVVATDASREQIANATPHPRVEYRVAREDASGLAAASADLVTVAQALHWLDPGTFFGEARRVLKPGGLLAAWCYVDPDLIEPALSRVLQDYYAGTVHDYWPPARKSTETGYRSIAFPFPDLEAPRLSLEMRPTLAEFTGYLRTWSATKRYVEAHGRDPVIEVERALRPIWGDPSDRKLLRWPLHLRVSRAPASS